MVWIEDPESCSSACDEPMEEACALLFGSLEGSDLLAPGRTPAAGGGLDEGPVSPAKTRSVLL